MLSPLVFAIVVHVVTESVRNGVKSEMFYADELVLMSEMMKGMREQRAEGEPREDNSGSE